MPHADQDSRGLLPGSRGGRGCARTADRGGRRPAPHRAAAARARGRHGGVRSAGRRQLRSQRGKRAARLGPRVRAHGAQRRPPHHAAPPLVRRMQWLASGLLLAAALVYAVAAWLEPRHPWLFYVSATAEAAMIGAIADWFAVTALFRHPLNLRFIPHTAVIPRNKARIAAGLSGFLQQNFLSADAVVARIAALRPARTLCGWLIQPRNAAMLAGYFARLLAYSLGAVDDARVRGFLLRAVSQAARRADLASAIAQLLDVLTEDARHHALLDEALAALDDLLAREDTRRFIAQEVAGSAPLLKYFSDLFHLKLDEKAALRIVDVALRKISEIRRDRDHELRRRFDAFVARFVEKLKRDAATRSKVHRMRDEVLESPALAGYVGGLWAEFRAWLGADLQGE